MTEITYIPLNKIRVDNNVRLLSRFKKWHQQTSLKRLSKVKTEEEDKISVPKMKEPRN